MLRMPRLQSQGSVGLLARAARPKPGMEGPGFSYPSGSGRLRWVMFGLGGFGGGTSTRRLGSKNAVGLETMRNQL